MLPGETIRNGAANKCSDCKETLRPRVLHSNAGYYIGTACQCGPYSRESEYYKTSDEAQKALDTNEVAWRD